MKRTTDIPKIPLEAVLTAAKLTDPAARFHVSNYYSFQEMRKRADMQLRHLGDRDTHVLLKYTADSSALVENQVRKSLKVYAESKNVGRWMMSHHGVAEVIAAGLLAHLGPTHPLMKHEATKYPDKEVGKDRVPTYVVGHWWRFAGLDPSSVWHPGEKRPWNAALKQICFHAGQCFKRVSGKGSLSSAPKDGSNIELEASEDCWYVVHWDLTKECWIDDHGHTVTVSKAALAADAEPEEPEPEEPETVTDDTVEEPKPKKWRPGWRPVGRTTPSFYGAIYRERKQRLVNKNEAGEFAERAKTFITKSDVVKRILAKGKLPPGNLDLQACRFATKIFLSHLHAVWFYDHFDQIPPKPFAIKILGHAHEIRVPNADHFPGFSEKYYGEARQVKVA